MQLVVPAAGGINMQLRAEVNSVLVYVPTESLPLAYPLAQSQISYDFLSFYSSHLIAQVVGTRKTISFWVLKVTSCRQNNLEYLMFP